MFPRIAIMAAAALMLAALPALAANPSWIISGAQTVTTSSAALPAVQLSNGVVLKADYANALTLYVGPCGSLTALTGYPLKAGEAISYGVTNFGNVCVLGLNTSDKIWFTGN